ncbi:MAG TPA: DUF2905 domain-containing protein [Parvularculaceae bacterium]|nr:DUF2905 domain-containing protein [Parvularculaceae bacterium]HNS88072.1 DUF2905 domain-containing protein [Parvularculaceae bacterium]
MQKTLIIIGALFLAAGLFWPVISKLGLGRLPGDIAIKGDGFSFYFPVATMIILSIVATVLFRLFGK